MAEFQIDLGVEVTDEITGYSGTITGRAEYLTGCRQYCVTSKAKDNVFKSTWFDEERLLKTKPAVAPPPGGPQSSPAPAK